LQADQLSDRSPIARDDQRGHGPHAIVLRETGFGIYINFNDLHAVSASGGDFL
jgi:hypothetical protein